MNRTFDDRRRVLDRLLALAGGGVVAGCAGGPVSYGAGVDYIYGPGWGSPWYGHDPFWDGPIYVGPPVTSRPGRPVTLPSFPSRPVAPGPSRPQLRPLPPPRPTPRPPPRPMPRGR
jgi:hypothetical protein